MEQKQYIRDPNKISKVSLRKIALWNHKFFKSSSVQLVDEDTCSREASCKILIPWKLACQNTLQVWHFFLVYPCKNVIEEKTKLNIYDRSCLKAEIVASTNVTAFQSGTLQTSFVPYCSVYVPWLFKKYFHWENTPCYLGRNWFNLCRF